MGKPVPLEDLPPEIRKSILPGTPVFKAYAELMERQNALPPGTLAKAEYKLSPGTDYAAVLRAAAKDAAKRAPAGDPSEGELDLQFGPFNTGVKMPQWASRLAAGTGKSFSDTYEGLKQMGTPTGLSDLIHDRGRAEADERQRLDKPLMDTGMGFTGNVLGTVAQAAVPATAAFRGAQALKAVAPMAGAIAGNPLVQGAAVGSALAGAQPVMTGDSRGANAAMGAVEGAVGTAIPLGLAAAARPAKEGATKAIGALADKANALGIPLRAAQVSGSKLLQWASAGLDKLPFGSGAALKANQQSAFNRALARSMGQDTDDAVTALATAKSELGKYYDDVKSKYDLQLEPWHVDFMKDGWDELLRKDIRPNKAGAEELKKIAASILRSTDDTGKMSGDTYKAIRSRLGDLANSEPATKDSAYKNVLKRYQYTLDSAFKSGLPEAEAARLTLADKQWSNMRTLEKIAPTDARGDFDFRRLAPLLSSRAAANAANREAFIYGKGDQNLADLGRVGKQFLDRGPEPWGSELTRTAKRIGEASVAPTAVAGGLWAMNHDDEHPWLKSLGEAGALALAAKGLGAANNSRWFERGVPWLRTMGEGATRGGLGQVYTGMKNAWKQGIDNSEEPLPDEEFPQ